MRPVSGQNGSGMECNDEGTALVPRDRVEGVASQRDFINDFSFYSMSS